LIKNLLNDKNFSLITVKDSRSSDIWNLAWITNIIPLKPTTITSLDANYVFPLYTLGANKTINLNQEVVNHIAKKVDLIFAISKDQIPNTFTPLDILDYIYALFYSPSYRERHNEFLKQGFPKIPYPKNRETFLQLVELGGELRQIHLLESNIVEQFITEFVGDGSNEVTKSMTNKSPGWIAYDGDPTKGDVLINDDQYFSGVPEIAWNFYIGGYQPAQKWLKDRKGRELSYDDIRHYQKIIVALTETDRIMKEIDKIDFE